MGLRWRHPREGSSKAQASIALLALGVVVIAAMTWQGVETEQSRDEALERLARDYSAVASWSFRRFASASLQGGLEHLMHPIHPSEDGRSGPGDAGVLLRAHRHSHDTCIFAGTEAVRAAIHFRLRGAPERVQLAGDLPSGLALPTITQRVTEAIRSGYPREWVSALLILDDGSTAHPVGYHMRREGADTLVWAVPFDVRGLTTLLEMAAHENDLLPPSLTGPMGSGEFLALGAWTSVGGLFWNSRMIGDALPAHAVALGARWAGLRIAATTLPEAVPRLAIGGMPESRLPVTLLLLALTLTLLALAIGHLRRVHELARLRSDFVSSVSHDLRTPLALQRVAIDTIRMGRARDASVLERSMANVDREATRLTNLVDNLLRFSSAEAGRSRLRLTQTELGDVVQSAVSGFRELVSTEDVSIIADIESPMWVEADPDAISRVLLNLLENAVKYGPDQQTIVVRLRSAHDHAHLTIEDQGPGIAPDEMDIIWQPFRRGVAAIGGAVGGSGIGLSVVREVVRGHHGTARVVNGVRGGACFEVCLPLSCGVQEAAQEPPALALHA